MMIERKGDIRQASWDMGIRQLFLVKNDQEKEQGPENIQGPIYTHRSTPRRHIKIQGNHFGIRTLADTSTF